MKPASEARAETEVIAKRELEAARLRDLAQKRKQGERVIAEVNRWHDLAEKEIVKRLNLGRYDATLSFENDAELQPSVLRLFTAGMERLGYRVSSDVRNVDFGDSAAPAKFEELRVVIKW